MSGKQKLIFHFACDGFFIASYCAVMLTHTKAGFFILFCAYWFYANLFFRKKPFPRLPGRELTTLETISWFAIGFSVLWIFGLVTYKGLQGNAAFMIPVARCAAFQS